MNHWRKEFKFGNRVLVIYYRGPFGFSRYWILHPMKMLFHFGKIVKYQYAIGPIGFVFWKG